MISTTIALLAFVFIVPCFYFKEVKVTLKLGRIHGFKETIFGNEVNVFLGIPYAAPPIGDLRFKKPQPIMKRWEKPLDATKWPKICMQDKGHFEYYSDTSEDCLYLNVWTPVNLKQNLAHNLKPVMIFIHGGGFLFMGSSFKHYNGVGLSSFGDVVMVTMNYRLGAFGFLSSGSDDTPGNIGLYDQALALKWVQENIAYFGGDPNNVTLFGESAGAWSTSFHILSPVSQDTFHRAIIMSGSIFNRMFWTTYKESNSQTLMLTKLLGCGVDEKDNRVSESHMKCLRKADAAKILELQLSPQIVSLSKALLKLPFMPIVGEGFIPQEPKKMIRQASFRTGVDVLVGTVPMEGIVIFSALQMTGYKFRSDDWRENLRDYIVYAFKGSSAEQVDELLSFYFKDIDDIQSDNAKMVFMNAFGDLFFNCEQLHFAEAFSKVNNLYQYFFDYTLSNQKDNVDLCDFDKACHANDVPIAMGTVSDAKDVEVSKKWMKIFSGFGKNGEVPWPKHDNQSKPYFHFTGNESTDKIKANFRVDACKLWKPLFDNHV